MRIYADVNRLPDVPFNETESVIIQVAPTPPVGTYTPVNGKFVVDVPDGVPVPPINVDSRIINPINNVVDPIFQGLLRAFPGYRHTVYNALLTSTDIALLDATATFPFDPGPPAQSWPVRFQTGGGSGVAPGSVALLPANLYAFAPKPGLIVTDTIDIGPLTGGLGAKSFLVYWKVYQMSVSDDVMNYSTGENTSAIKNLVEMDQTMIECFLSVNDGAGYTPVTRLSPCVTCDPGTLIRLAFVNHNPFKVYLAAYAVMF